MTNFDKQKVREQLTLENIFDLITEYGGNPEYTNVGIISSTICHNFPGEGSRKLYYYENTQLFRCYTGCDSTFDIFELTMKVFMIQQGKKLSLNEAVRYVANRFGFSGEYMELDLDIPADWKIFDHYSRIQDIELKNYSVELKEYDNSILHRLNYNIHLTPWIKENISQEAINKAEIGYFPGSDMITIPHFDANNRFIGLRGRALALDDIERYGKYRPIKINQQLYNHPLGMNLYGLNWAKDNIKIINKAIIFESERKISLQFTFLAGRRG